MSGVCASTDPVSRVAPVLYSRSLTWCDTAPYHVRCLSKIWNILGNIYKRRIFLAMNGGKIRQRGPGRRIDLKKKKLKKNSVYVVL